MKIDTMYTCTTLLKDFFIILNSAEFLSVIIWFPLFLKGRKLMSSNRAVKELLTRYGNFNNLLSIALHC